MKRIYAWAPVGIWMTIIFALSSRSRIQISEEETFNFLLFKTLHMLEYAFLHMLIYRAIRYENPKKKSIQWAYIAYCVSVLYAASDEIHQTLVPTREGHPRDVIIDSIGIVLSWISITKLYPILPKKLRQLASRWLLVS